MPRSRRQSATNSSAPPETPTIYLDACLGGPLIAEGLRAHGLIVHCVGEGADFPQQLSDEAWTGMVAARGWVGLTRDKRIRYRAAEKAAVAKAGIALFVLTSRSNLARQDIIENIVAAAPAIARFFRRNTPPSIAGVARDGKVSMLAKL